VSKSRRALQEIVGYLSDQLTRGWAALLVARQLDRAGREERLGRARSTLGATHEACVESAILAFARLAISHKDSISVEYLLNCAYHSPSAFPLPERAAVMEAVARHRALLHGLRPLVERVKDYRDRTIAHLDKKHVNHTDVVQSRPPVDLGEVERAFETLLEVINAYRGYLDQPALDVARLRSELSEEWAYLYGLAERGDRGRD
jgi:hypothetical protein